MITPEEAEKLDDAVGDMLDAYGSWSAGGGTMGSEYHETVVKYYAVLNQLTEGK